jgi:hypothetical protein
MRAALACAFAVAVTLASATSRAQVPGAAPAAPPPAAAPSKPRSFESSAGLKLLAGGNVWSTPSEVPAGYDGLGFAGNGGGFGFGGALYYEARFIQHLGLELDLGYDQSTLQRDVTINGVVKVREKVTSSGLRWGLLAKGIFAAPFGRMWIGLGPEFVSGSSVDAKNEITEGRQYVTNASQIEDAISAKSKSSTMLTLAAGLAIHLGDNLEIPVDLRAAKNLSQDDKWADRVRLDLATTKYEVTAQSSWDFRLATGLGYRF